MENKEGVQEVVLLQRSSEHGVKILGRSADVDLVRLVINQLVQELFEGEDDEDGNF